MPQTTSKEIADRDIKRDTKRDTKSDTKSHAKRDVNRDITETSKLLEELSDLRNGILEDEGRIAALWQSVPTAYQASARNLLHYLSLRRHDIRPLQERLAALGLSSLGRSEAHVLGTLNSVIGILRLLSHEEERDPHPSTTSEVGVGYAEGEALLDAHTEALLGARPAHRQVHIMVTMSTEAAQDYDLVRSLLASGMDCMRINCAHDDTHAWANMVAHLRRAEAELGKRCRILMDLAGPKLRTGAVESKPSRLKWKPSHKHSEHEIVPARIWLHPAGTSSLMEKADAVMPVAGTGFDLLRAGDALAFENGCQLVIMERAPEGCWASCVEKASVVSGTPLEYRPAMPELKSGVDLHVAELPPVDGAIPLQLGDILVLTRDAVPGQAAEYATDGNLLHPAHIPCLPPDILADVQVGEHIWLDDGKFGGTIQRASRDEAWIDITHTPTGGGRLRAEKGINLPDSHLQLATLTAKDKEDLKFVAVNADFIGMSFVQSGQDVHDLLDRLVSLGEHLERYPGIVLKIETQRAFNSLPELMLAAMKASCAGVMIARGDLAVEVGFERLSEVQEEILWICEAAHMPVIWATQVLENMAQSGMPSRAEITDAAMGVRAECVMLNKGPYVVDAVRSLDDILCRMETHMHKKQPLLRALHAWGELSLTPYIHGHI